MSACVLSRCYHCLKSPFLPSNKSFAEKICRKITTGRFTTRVLPVCESTKRLSWRQEALTTTTGAQVHQIALRRMSSVVEPKEATSTMGKWKEKFWAFLTKTDHPTKLPLKHLQAAGSILILTITDYVAYEEILEASNLVDSFYSFYKVLELHMWIMLQRLRQEDNDGLVAGMALVDSMWRDLEPRFKIVGAQMSQKTDGMYYLNNHFQSSILVYDEAMLDSDDMALAHAIWLNVYDGKECDPRCLEVLVGYTRKQMKHLQTIDSKTLLSGQKISFLPIDQPKETKKTRTRKEYHIPRVERTTKIID
uniref:Ubiquinol-cytochrome-c reductase complex assembly factor 1-like n=1 Tax=Crassostrea virginica TaxID=6565 RepID=A0A8B8D955_CRAVI|nr:ubiquinol-cytochrome-c reductase complex assembly factor 1-like [Crassostrea virginica]